MIVNSNPTAKLAQRYLNRATSSHADSMKKLASGSRINSAKDDAAGLQISNRLQAQRSGIEVAIRNASDATSMLQTAEGAMAEYSENLMRMRDLTLQYANGANSSEDHDAIRQEFNALKDELKRITETTSFGGQRLLNGTSGDRSFQIGSDAGEAIHVQLPNMTNIGEQFVEKRDGEISAYAYGFRDDWRSKPGDIFAIRSWTDSYAPPLLSVKLEEGASVRGIMDKINSELGDKMQAYTYKTWDDSEISYVAFYPVDDELYSMDRLETHLDSLNIDKLPMSIRKIWSDGQTPWTPSFLMKGEYPKLENGASITIEHLDLMLKSVDSERAS